MELVEVALVMVGATSTVQRRIASARSSGEARPVGVLAAVGLARRAPFSVVAGGTVTGTLIALAPCW